MRFLLSLSGILSCAVASAVTFAIPDFKLDKPWQSPSYPSSNGEIVRVSFTLAGKGKASGVLVTNSSRSTYRKFTAVPGENRFDLELPKKASPIRLVILNLAPSAGSDLAVKDLRIGMDDRVRYGDFENVRAYKNGYTGWWGDRTRRFRIENGRASAVLAGEPRCWLEQWIYLPPDKVFTLSADVNAAGFSGRAGFELIFRGGGKGFDKILHHMPVVGDTGGTRKIYYTFKTPARLKYCALRLAAVKSTGRIEFDNVELHPGSFVPAVPVSKDFSRKLFFGGFFRYNRSGFKREMAPALTEVALATDDSSLVISGVCREPLADKLKADPCKHDDGRLYNNDNMEIFIDAQGIGRSCYQVIVTPSGAYADLAGRDTSWNGAQVSAGRNADGWTFEVKIPFTAMGYGPVEASLPDKRLGVAFFRNRRTTNEIYSMPYWDRIGYAHPQAFLPVVTSGNADSSAVDPAFVGSEADARTDPSMAWRTPDPLFRELMGSEKLFKDGEITGYFYNGFLEYGNDSYRPVTVFGLHHGISYNYLRDVAGHYREGRLVCGITHYPVSGADAKERTFAARMNRKYGTPLLFDTNLKRSDGIFSQKNAAPPIVRKVNFFWGDPRTWEQKRRQIDAVLKHWGGQMRVVRLGHEDDEQPGKFYTNIRSAYLAKDPETWKKWEDEAKREFGGGKIGFPATALRNASPVERLVWLRFARKQYIAGVDHIISFLRKNYPRVKISSCVGTSFPYAFGYDALFGKFDWVTTQTRWGGGPDRQEAGFLSKYLTDISGSPAAPCVHIEAYFVSLTPQDAREVLSQVFRAGGSSFQLALFDWYGNSQSDLFGAPERFYEVMHIFKLLPKMNRLVYPEADCAIFSSNADRLATHYVSREPDRSGLEPLFTMLGPHNRSWFHFITEQNIADGTRKLADYKVVYVPPASYLDDDTVKALLDYVKNGGNLVIFSRNTFRFRLDGTERTPLVPGKSGKGEIVLVEDVKLDEKIYSDGKAPARFAALQKKFNCRTGHDIWRFTFPAAPEYKPWPANSECLTGNACRWRRNIPVAGPNAKVKFTCSYENPPDLVPDAGNALFNRRKALESPLIQGRKLDWRKRLASWAVAWKNTDPAAVTLDFAEPVTASGVKLWLHGGYDEITVFCDGGKCASFKRPGGGEPEVDVDEVVIPFPAVRGKKFQVRFGRRTGVTWLAELELWK